MSGKLPRARPRLLAVTELIAAGSRVADIGSDHGRLPRLLIGSGRAAWCIATEYGNGPAGRLRAEVTACPEADRIEVRQGNGLDPLRPEDRIDGLVLSGMGGATMLSILDAARLSALGVKWLVLQPQSGWAGLRAGLAQRDWSVSSERLVRDRGRFYTVMHVLSGPPTLKPPSGFNELEWYELGPCWFRDRDPVAIEYWTERSSRARERLRRARGEGLRYAHRECELSDRALAALKSPRVG
jgi:tRNA (adenine22-N1)-methyltransferase